MFTRRAREHRRMPEVLIFVHNSVEHPVVERCFLLQSSTSDPSGHRLNREGRFSASPRESMTSLRDTFHHEKYHVTIVVNPCPNQCQTLPKKVEALQVQLSLIKRLQTLLERTEH